MLFTPLGEAPAGTTIIVADEGRGTLGAAVETLLEKRHRVLAVDPFYFGEPAISEKDFFVCAVDRRGGGTSDRNSSRPGGSNNLEELLAGTDPHNASDLFQIVGIATMDEGFTIEWTSVAGKSYTIESSANAAAPWETVAGKSIQATH